MMDETKLQEIEARVKAATPHVCTDGTSLQWEVCSINFPDYERDLVLNAREDIPALIAAVRERDARITALETSLEAERTLRLCVHDEWQEAESELREANARIAELEAAMPLPGAMERLAKYFRDNNDTSPIPDLLDEAASRIRKAQGE